MRVSVERCHGGWVVEESEEKHVISEDRDLAAHRVLGVVADRLGLRGLSICTAGREEEEDQRIWAEA